MKEICGCCGGLLVYDKKKHKMVCVECGKEYEPEAEAWWFEECGIPHPF